MQDKGRNGTRSRHLAATTTPCQQHVFIDYYYLFGMISAQMLHKRDKNGHIPR
jgi:hypothetical protein